MPGAEVWKLQRVRETGGSRDTMPIRVKIVEAEALMTPGHDDERVTRITPP
jgi:hypothetical protein